MMESVDSLLQKLMIAHAVELLRQGRELLRTAGVRGQPAWDRQVESFLEMVPAEIQAMNQYEAA